MKITLNRTISFLLALAMVFGMLPAFGTLEVYANELDLKGWIDEAYCPEPGKLFVEGWALNAANLNDTVEIHIYIGDANAYDINLGKTDYYRADIVKNVAGDKEGNFGFRVTLDLTNYENYDKFGSQKVYAHASWRS